MHDYFTNLSPRALERLEQVQTRRAVAGGHILFLEGQEGSSMYRLIKGAVRLFRSTPDGREVTIHLVQPGDLFAEIVLFERDTYPVSAVTVEPSTIAVIPRQRIHALMSDESFREEFLRNLVAKMRFLSQQLYVLATMDVRQRLLRFLEVRYGRQAEIISDLSKRDTAAAISVRPETLSRTLAALAQEGLIHWSGAQITVDARAWEQV